MSIGDYKLHTLLTVPAIVFVKLYEHLEVNFVGLGGAGLLCTSFKVSQPNCVLPGAMPVLLQDFFFLSC